MSKKKGIIAISGHIGNWELAALALTLRNFLLTPIVKNMKNIDNIYLYHQLRAKHGGTFIEKNKSMKKIFETLKQNKILCLVIDQSAGAKEGIKVPFLGKEAYTYNQAIKIAQKTKSPMLGICIHRSRKPYHHHISIENLNLQDKNDIKLSTSDMAEMVSTFILKEPSQWIWMHRRWKD